MGPRPKSATPAGAAVGVALMFASNGALFASLIPWYPLILERLDITTVQFGLAVAAYPLGAILSLGLPSRLISLLGPVRLSILSTFALGVAIAGASFTHSLWMLAVCLAAAGYADATADVAQNVVGIRVQDALRRPVLSTMHAMWSLGGICGGAISTWSATLDNPIRLHLVCAAILGTALVTLGAIVVQRYTPSVATGRRKTAPSRSIVTTGFEGQFALKLLPIAILAICGTMVEEIANSWAALSLAQITEVSANQAGIAFVVVIGSQCAGRFVGDPLVRRFGASRIARTGGVLIGLGGILIVTTVHAPPQFLVGLGLIGYGSATLVPSALSQAAKTSGISEGAGVTFVSWSMRLGFLATSPLVGSLAELVGVRGALVMTIVAGALSVLYAGHLTSGSSRRTP